MLYKHLLEEVPYALVENVKTVILPVRACHLV